MFTSINSSASSTLSVSSGEPYYPAHGLPLWDRYPYFSPLQVRGEAWLPPPLFPSAQPEPEGWSPFQPAQIVPYNWITETPPSAQPDPEDWSPPLPQPEQDMDDIKLPPHVLEHLDNSQVSSGYELYDDPTKLHTFRQRKLEQMVVHFSSERLEQEKKQKDKEQLIEELQRKGNMLEKKERAQEKKLKDQEQLIEELQRKGKMVEKKEKAQEKKLKGYRYRIGKRYNTRSGKN
jgi:hypothetical protein